MKITSFDRFKKMARPGMRVPIVAVIPNDLQTPVAIYQNFLKEKFRFLLESVEGGEKWGRYSFIGLFPSVIFRSNGRKVEIIENGKKLVVTTEDPLGELKKNLEKLLQQTPSPASAQP